MTTDTDARLYVLEEKVRGLEALLNERHSEVERRLGETNNAHAMAVAEKRRTDEALLKVQEGSVTKEMLDAFRQNIDQRINSLDLSRSMGTGRESAVEQTRVMVRWTIGLFVTVLLSGVVMLISRLWSQ